MWWSKLKRKVALGLRAIAGRPVHDPETGARSGFISVGRTDRELVSLAWPIATALLGDTAMGLVDTKLVGNLGAEALGGVGVGTTLMWLCYSVVFGLMRGVKVRASYAVGEGRAHDSVRYAQGGIVLGAVIGVFVWTVGRDISWALHALSIHPSLVPAARSFLAARTYGAVSVAVLSALVQWRQGLGDTRSPMVVGLVGNVINGGLAYGLIYGHFGLPAMGVAGAGYATATAETLEALAMVALLVRDVRAAKTTLKLRAAIDEVFELGGPTGLHFGVETLAFTAFTAILGQLGAQEIAAHQIALAVIRTSFLPGVAVSEAASVLVGRALSRNALGEADRVLRSALMLAVGFMVLCGIVFALAGEWIVHAFTTDPHVAVVGRRLLLVAAVFQAMDAMTIVLRGALRGAKDVRVVAIVGATVSWVCVPGAALVLGRVAGMGALGGWLGFIAETAISAVVFTMRWHRGSWREVFAGRASAAEAVAMAEPSAG